MIEVELVRSSALYTATLVSLPYLADDAGEVLTLAGSGLSYRSFQMRSALGLMATVILRMTSFQPNRQLISD